MPSLPTIASHPKELMQLYFPSDACSLRTALPLSTYCSANCGIAESPQWRRPSGKKIVLCNACGIYYSRHHTLPKRKKVGLPPLTCFA